ncbi:hypothetical protein Aduo_012887 [Ancylostoma duodenale]
MEFPAPGIPFMFVNVDGQSTRAQNMSHFNPAEVDTCHVPSLAAVPFWRRVIEWATSLHAIVTPETVERYFHDV